MADITLGSSAFAVSARSELSIQDCTVTTTTLQVAQFFDKRHRDVMRAIKNLPNELPESDTRNFAQICVNTKIKGAGGGRQPDGQLPERAQVRELRAATKASVAPATSPTAVASPVPPHIGHDCKPLPPPGTFRAVFV